MSEPTYPCCPHCGGLGDQDRFTDNPADGLPEGCGDSPHTSPCAFGCDKPPGT